MNPRKYDVVRYSDTRTTGVADNRYQILETNAVHTETCERLIIYKSLQNNQIYAKPCEAFRRKFQTVRHCQREISTENGLLTGSREDTR